MRVSGCLADPPRFIADEMLMRLGRWLRAAGHDVLIYPPGTPDAMLIARARSEGRQLLTRDRRLGEFSQAGRFVLVLAGNDTESCALELKRRIGLDWLYRPFSRCMLCNHPLEEGSAEDLQRVPEESRRLSTYCRRCPSCRKLYWEGSHTRRMLARLKAWQAA